MSTKKQRLDRLFEVLSELTDGIRLVQEALHDPGDPQVTLAMADTVLSKLGWVAERATVVAGGKTVDVVGGADEWFLGPGHPLVRPADER